MLRSLLQVTLNLAQEVLEALLVSTRGGTRLFFVNDLRGGLRRQV